MTDFAKEVRKTILDLAYYGQDANIQSNFSSVEIINVIYQRCLNISNTYFNDPFRDKFVLSKGQSSMNIIALLSLIGVITKTELETVCQLNSRLSMQFDRTKLPFIEASAGSLGHGMPIAVGMAWANKINKISSKIYTLVGDGELNEGTIWESCFFASSEKLDNLVIVIDDNNSINNLINIGSIFDKFLSFGFEVIECDGHNENDIFDALNTNHFEKPLAVIAKTKRGYGSKTIMNDNLWFHHAPNIQELVMLKKEIDEFE